MGNNPSNGTNEDYDYVRCKNCNHWVDKSVHKPAKRNRSRRVSYAQLSPAPSSDNAPYDDTVNRGCPWCGTQEPY